MLRYFYSRGNLATKGQSGAGPDFATVQVAGYSCALSLTRVVGTTHSSCVFTLLQEFSSSEREQETPL